MTRCFTTWINLSSSVQEILFLCINIIWIFRKMTSKGESEGKIFCSSFCAVSVMLRDDKKGNMLMMGYVIFSRKG